MLWLGLVGFYYLMSQILGLSKIWEVATRKRPHCLDSDTGSYISYVASVMHNIEVDKGTVSKCSQSLFSILSYSIP